MESSRAEVESRVNCLWDYYTSCLLYLQDRIAIFIAIRKFAQIIYGRIMHF